MLTNITEHIIDIILIYFFTVAVHNTLMMLKFYEIT